MLKTILEILWMAFPMISIYFVLFAFWWPREDMPWGRMGAISFVLGILMMLYAGCASDVFNKIQAMDTSPAVALVGETTAEPVKP